MRRATAEVHPESAIAVISIHALHEESDRGIEQHRPKQYISIHALHEESDQSTATH